MTDPLKTDILFWEFWISCFDAEIPRSATFTLEHCFGSAQVAEWTAGVIRAVIWLHGGLLPLLLTTPYSAGM